MPTFLVTRIKKYTSTVEAKSEKDAQAQAEYLAGKEWKLSEDKLGEIKLVDDNFNHVDLV